MFALARWLCEACGHRNPVSRMECRRCRTARPLGAWWGRWS